MKRILIVDDSIVSRKILRKLFETEGFEVVGEAINGKEGYLTKPYDNKEIIDAIKNC